MSAHKVDMHRLQEFVRLHRLGHSSREVSRLLKLGRNTQRHYKRLFNQAGLLNGPPDELPELEALKRVIEREPSNLPHQQRSSLENWSSLIWTLLARGAGPTAIYDKLRTDHPDFTGSLGAVKRVCLRLRKETGPSPEDVAIPVISAPGEIAQVDFGFAGRLFDPETGETRRAWVFVLVLAHSRHMFARVVFDQSAMTWQHLHIEAFKAFGGVPHTVVPDNLKAAVIRASFTVDEPSGIQRGYCELARYYGFKVDPTPVRDPRKKGKVESGVKYVKHNFFKPRRFADINEANRELSRWVEVIAGCRTHGTTGKKPLAHFDEVERPALLPLPEIPFEPVRWQESKVGKDAHIHFDRRLYSVPWQLLGETVWVRATPSTVVIFHRDGRVATHPRRGQNPRSTQETHLPADRVAWRHRSPSYWQERAEVMGSDVAAYVAAVLSDDGVVSQIRVVQASMALLAKCPPERANAVCRRALYFGALGYRSLKSIIQDGLDSAPYGAVSSEMPTDFASPRFARPVDEFVARVGG